MTRISFLIPAFCVVVILILQPARAQFPLKIKIPKSRPTPTQGAQPSTTTDAQPTQPQTENRNPPKQSVAASNGGPYAKRLFPTETPVFLPETLDITCDKTDSYWKVLNSTNYSSWVPKLSFRVFYGGSARLRYKADYLMPDGSPWFGETLDQRGDRDETNFTYLIASEYDSNKYQGKALTGGGTFGVKITNMRDNSVVFQGKFKVVKRKSDVTDAKYRNKFDFYVDQDWNLPIGYAGVNWKWSKDSALPFVQMWFKGGLNASDLEARLYRDEQQIATTDEGGDVSVAETRNRGGHSPAEERTVEWILYQFDWHNKILFINNAHARALTSNKNKLFINESPGEYTVKVFYKGEQVRETKFAIADGNFADNGIAAQSRLTTNKIILPVKLSGNIDKWDASAWRADAFYGNALPNFNAP